MREMTPIRTETGLPIAVVERETGLGKDTLRVWEKRYGFPLPLRDTAGDRLYPSDQVEQLRLICRLLNAGQRPSKVVGLDKEALQSKVSELMQTHSNAKPKRNLAPPDQEALIESLLSALDSHDPQTLRNELTHAQLRMGMADFVIDLVAPLTIAVGDAWAKGRFEVFAEHLFTEVMTSVLRSSIFTLAPLSNAGGPKVLLTTLPQEMHALGLLMVEALLALEGFTCVSLGTQTPISDIVQAANAHHVDIVALSFTSVLSGESVLASLGELRAQLPAETALLVGGSCSALYKTALSGVTAIKSLVELRRLLAHWRKDHLKNPVSSGEQAKNPNLNS